MKVRVVVLAAVGFAVAALASQTGVRAQGDEASKTVWDGVYTEEQARRGEQVNQEFCAACHGPAGGGGEMAPPLAGPAFSANWNGLTLYELVERIRVTMPQDRPGALTRQQNADIIAFMLSLNKFPAGKTELSRQPEFLRQIRFVTFKPAH